MSGMPGWQRDRLAVLLDALDGIPVSGDEMRILIWLAGWEADTVHAVANLVRRARQAAAETAGRVAALAAECGDLAEQTGNGDLAALVFQLRAVLEPNAQQPGPEIREPRSDFGPEIGMAPADFAGPGERCTKITPGTRLTCLQALAEGWVTASDLCPRCTRRFVAALESAASAAEPLLWHRAYVERAKERPDA